MRVVTWNNDELATDALPIHGFEHYKENDYSLAHAPFSGKNTFSPCFGQGKTILNHKWFSTSHYSNNCNWEPLNAGSSYAGGQWAAGDEPLYYIVSLKDVIIAKPRLVSLSDSPRHALSLCNVIFCIITTVQLKEY